MAAVQRNTGSPAETVVGSVTHIIALLEIKSVNIVMVYISFGVNVGLGKETSKMVKVANCQKLVTQHRGASLSLEKSLRMGTLTKLTRSKRSLR